MRMDNLAYEVHLQEQMVPELRPGRDAPLWLTTCPCCGQRKIIMLIPFHALWEEMDDEIRAIAFHDPESFMEDWYRSLREELGSQSPQDSPGEELQHHA